MSDLAPSSTSPAVSLRAVWRLPQVAQLAVTVLLLGLALSFASPYLALFGVNRAQMTPLHLGFFLTVTAVSSVLISARLARLSDRLPDRKPLVLLTLGAAVLGYGLLSVTRSYPALLLIGAVLLGTGAAAFPQVFAFARAQLGEAEGTLPDRAITLLRSVFSLAWVVGPGVGALALARLDFVGLFLLAAACFLLAALTKRDAQAPPFRAGVKRLPPEGRPSRSPRFCARLNEQCPHAASTAGSVAKRVGAASHVREYHHPGVPLQAVPHQTPRGRHV